MITITFTITYLYSFIAFYSTLSPYNELGLTFEILTAQGEKVTYAPGDKVKTKIYQFNKFS